jgi:hypothetical protein
MSITCFELFGERCSGTNFLEEAITANFELTYKNEGRNKHFFCHNNYDSTYDNTLFIGIVRHPINWLNSYHVEMHNIPKQNRKNIMTFLFNPFYSVDVINYNDKNKNNQTNFSFNINYTLNKEIVIQEDKNYVTGGKYKNIFELRKLKNEYLMNIMSKKVKHYILLNYEILLNNFQETLGLLRDTFQLKQKHVLFQTIKKYKKSTFYNFVKQREILFSPQIIQIIWNNLDKEQENKLGYS